MLNIKEAVASAKKYAEDVFSAEGVKDLLLEEVDFDDVSKAWLVTVSFLRQQVTQNQNPNSVSTIAEMLIGGSFRRIFKIVHVNAETGELIRVTNRETGLAA